MINTLIVDDELKARETLSDLIINYCPDIRIVSHADSVKNALPIIIKHKPDLVFLDIEMPFENGFKLFERFPEHNFNVIFVTAYDQYAIKAIKFSAMDYLLKPVDPDELIAATERVRNQKFIVEQNRKKVDLLLKNLDAKKAMKQIILPSCNEYFFVNLDTIIRCSADSNYTTFYLSNGKSYLVSKNLGEYEKLLEDKNFFRIHNSHLINLNHIRRYIKGEGGSVVMSDEAVLEVSRRKKNEFLELLAIK